MQYCSNLLMQNTSLEVSLFMQSGVHAFIKDKQDPNMFWLSKTAWNCRE